MMKTKYISLLLVLTSLISLQSKADSWSLKQCITYALEHNIQVKQKEYARQQSEIVLNTAKNGRLPNLNAQIVQDFAFGRGLTADNTYTNQNTNQTQFGLSSSLPLFNGYKTKNTINQSKLNLFAATADLLKIKDDIRVAVAQAYVEILYNMEIVDVAKRQIELDSQQVHRLEIMVKRGKSSEAELMQQKATQANSELEYTQSMNTLKMAYLSLAQLLELDSPEGFSIIRPSKTVENITLASPITVYNEALSNRPEIMAEQYRLNSAERNIDIAKSAKYPQLSLAAGIGSNYYKTSGYSADSFFKQLNHNLNETLELSLVIPIFNRYETRNNIKKAHIAYNNQQLILDNVRKNLYKEIQQAYYNAENAHSKYQSCQTALASSREAFKLMQVKYENGKATMTEFNESKNNYLQAESKLAQAEYEYLYTSNLLNFYKDGKLEF